MPDKPKNRAKTNPVKKAKKPADRPWTLREIIDAFSRPIRQIEEAFEPARKAYEAFGIDTGAAEANEDVWPTDPYSINRPSGEAIKPEPANPATPERKRPRIELSEARQEFRIDEIWYRLKGEKHVRFLEVLIKQKGEWIGGKNLDDPQKKQLRPDKILKSLPEPVREIIETRKGPSGGYRIKPEYFE